MARRQLHSQVPTKLGEAIPLHILSKLRDNIRETKVLRRGDVIWLSLPQTLWHKDSHHLDSYKTRPFLVADEIVSFERDIGSKCLSSVSILGIDLTGAANLIPGRPHLSLQIPGSDIRSYVWFDTLRTIEIKNLIVKDPIYQLSAAEIVAMTNGLDTILKPQVAFKLFADKLGAGRFCDVRVKGIEVSSALVVLKPPLFDRQRRAGCSHERPPHIVVVMERHTQGGPPSIPPSEKLSIIHTYGVALTNFGNRDQDAARKILNTLRRRAGLEPLSTMTLWDSARSMFSRLHLPQQRLGHLFKTAISPLARP